MYIYKKKLETCRSTAKPVAYLQKDHQIREQKEDQNVKAHKIIAGVLRESNSRPLAPEARIIPLDQTPTVVRYSYTSILINIVHIFGNQFGWDWYRVSWEHACVTHTNMSNFVLHALRYDII